MKNIIHNLIWIYKRCKKTFPLIILLIILGSLGSLLSVGTALITKKLIDSASSNNMDEVIKWITLFALLLLLRIVISSVQSIVSTYSSEKTKNRLQEQLYNHIIYSTWSNHKKYHSIELLTRMTNDTDAITNLLVAVIPGIISLFVMFASSFVALLYISPIMAVTALAIFPFLMLASKIYGRKLKQFYISIQKKQTECNRFIQESFNNILIVKSFCLETSRINTLNTLQNEKLNLSIKKSYLSCISNGLLSLSSMLGYFIVFAWGSLTITTTSTAANFGNLTAMFQLFQSIQAPIYSLASAFPQVISACAAAERLMEIESMEVENIRFLKPRSIKNKDLDSYNNSDEIAATTLNNISFNNVSYSYIKGTPILKDISLNIDNGETIGLIGPSGEGKTTIIRLLLSLISPENGSIKINGIPLTVKDRNLISYVPQGNTLFSGTILENLKFGNPDATDEQIDKALKMSCAYNFVNTLDCKLNTIIGEKGLGISEGQAQRLTIARALLRKRPILILDEATSSLDPETELKVLEELKNITPKPTCIIITHRPSALNICDKIYKLENKKIHQIEYSM
ncbi:MAG TPA: ABC transporter ATP-binding protein [Clostridium sp.]|nr:ABC transporter ATP-binding protein [Clostridium sp.]